MPTADLLPPSAERASTTPARERRRDAAVAVLVGLVVLVAAVGATWPVPDSAFNDDWSYHDTARQLAATGRLAYDGWSSASLVAQAYWGAAWIKVLGPSHQTLRYSTAPLAAAAVSAWFLLARRAGLGRAGAAFAALLVGLSPLYLPQAVTFMTDAPGLFAIGWSLYALVRAYDADRVGPAVAWLAAGMVVGAVGGTGRQIVWVVPVAVAPYAALARWGRRRPREWAFAAATVAGWVAVLATAALTVRWFNAQPRSIREPNPVGDIWVAATNPVRFANRMTITGLTLAWMTLPAAGGLLWAAVRGPRRWVILGLAAATLVGLVGYRAVVRSTPNPIPAFVPWMENTLDERGVLGTGELAGHRPMVWPTKLRAALAATTYVAVWSAVFAMAGAVARRPVRAWVDWVRRPVPGAFAGPAMAAFALAYTALIMPRAARGWVYDRYVLPLIPCLAVLLLSTARRARPSAWAWAALAAYAAVGIGLTQDVSALARARSVAIARLTDRGVPRTAIDAGTAFNCETQLGRAGYVNDSRITPASLYAAGRPLTWAVRPTYRLEADLGPGLEPSPLGGVGYRSLLPPFRRTVRIDRYTDDWLREHDVPVHLAR